MIVTIHPCNAKSVTDGTVRWLTLTTSSTQLTRHTAHTRSSAVAERLRALHIVENFDEYQRRIGLMFNVVLWVN